MFRQQYPLLPEGQTLVRNNYIANHGSSGILTSTDAEKTLINGNQIERNGATGMPEAVRLSGKIGGTELIANRNSESGGSTIYLIKNPPASRRGIETQIFF